MFEQAVSSMTEPNHSTPRYRVGVVGASRGHELVSSLMTDPRAQVTAVCDISDAVLNEAGARLGLGDEALSTDYGEFLDRDLDIVVVATPIALHAEQAIQAMESGRHVLSEQTAAYTVEDCEALVETVRRTGRKYSMAENYTYFHYIRSWRELVDHGDLGRIYYAEGEYIHEIIDELSDPEDGQPLWRYTRPPIWYCAHCLGPLLTLMDDRIVKATGLHTGSNKYPGKGVGYIDMEVGLFQTEKGSIIKILRSQTASRYPELVWYSLYGTGGMVENGREGGWGETQGRLFLDREMKPEEGAVVLPCPTDDADAPPEAKVGGHGTSEYFLVRDFLDTIEYDREPPIGVVRATDFTIPGIIAHQAAQAGGVWLDVPLLS
jgi:predicted dehydrogenase